MYLAHWNLREEPFQNVTDPRFAYLADQHREGLARLLYLIRGRKLGGVLIGPYGVGKSMVLELLAQHMQTLPQTRLIRFDVPPGGAAGLARQIFWGVGATQPFEDMAGALDLLRNLCANPKSGFHHTVVALDEAQLIREAATYEFLHLLTNLRIAGREGVPDQPAFTLILSGHEKLTEVLARDPSLCQRLQMVWHLEPLNEQQTVEYVQLRMRAAGGDIWVFDEDALREVCRAAGGIPRVINNICDVALMMGCAVGATRVTRPLVLQAVADVQSPALFAQAAANMAAGVPHGA